MKKQSVQKISKQTNFTPCYYIPKIFIKDIKFSNYSMDSKILAGIMLSMAKNTDEVIEAITLLNAVGKEQLTVLMDNLKEMEELNNGGI